MIVPMNETASQMMLIILTTYRSGTPEDRAKLYLDVQIMYFSAKVLAKRLEVLPIPAMESSAVMALAVLSQGNPGRAILGMIETYEKADEVKPPIIDVEFVCMHVYPIGFYDEEEVKRRFDARRTKKETKAPDMGKYDFII